MLGLISDSVAVDLDKGTLEASANEQKAEPHEDASLEPFVGMEFDSEDSAREFYLEYARRVGFVVRVMQRRQSGLDGRTLARRLGCNKQGFSPNQRGDIEPGKKPRSSTREGCNATILVKMEKSRKWVVSRFVKEHNHPLAAPVTRLSTVVDKDRRINFLRSEIERQDQLCGSYRDQLLNFMKIVEQQNEELSLKLQGVVENVKKLESEMLMYSRHR
ncbi:hypothetical protein SAY87_010223 [Trapa incisa]|uniref:FAR1 domain-containing protein n=1 Tax=Trapa incisa TaxID=236973 RepID=A0AAN7GHF1_9MYRT|nr:hypothetical protein SAY87_010223 [Trapa incisa]